MQTIYVSQGTTDVLVILWGRNSALCLTSAPLIAACIPLFCPSAVGGITRVGQLCIGDSEVEGESVGLVNYLDISSEPLSGGYHYPENEVHGGVAV